MPKMGAAGQTERKKNEENNEKMKMKWWNKWARNVCWSHRSLIRSIVSIFVGAFNFSGRVIYSRENLCKKTTKFFLNLNTFLFSVFIFREFSQFFTNLKYSKK
jgi:hypothetical protein